MCYCWCKHESLSQKSAWLQVKSLPKWCLWRINTYFQLEKKPVHLSVIKIYKLNIINIKFSSKILHITWSISEKIWVLHYFFFWKQKAEVLEGYNSKLGFWRNNIYWVSNKKIIKNNKRKQLLKKTDSKAPHGEKVPLWPWLATLLVMVSQ